VLFGFLVLLTCGASSALAQRQNPISGTTDAGSDYPLLTNEIPGMVIVITQEQIRMRGYRSVYEVLRDLPNFTTRGGFGQSPVRLSMDGDWSFNNEKFLLYIDGVLEQDIWRRSIWLSFQYSMAFIKHITVFYGPAATRFGANAMSGVIFIDTKKAEDLGGGYGIASLTKDVFNNMWAVDFMVGHSYNRRTSPKLAKNLFSWYLRGRFYFADERNSTYNSLWNPSNWATDKPPLPLPNDPYRKIKLAVFDDLNRMVDTYQRNYLNAFPKGNVANARQSYRLLLVDQFLKDFDNSGNYKNPYYQNRNLAYNAELGIRFDNWFLRFYVWSMGFSNGLQYMPTRYQPNTSSAWVRNMALSLNHLKSEMWSSGVGEDAQVIYFNLSLIFRRNEIPGDSLQVNFQPQRQVFFGRECTVSTVEGQRTIPCYWDKYSWKTTYNYVVSSSFRAEPKLDFRLFSGRWEFSAGFNTGVALIQGSDVTSPYPNPQDFASGQVVEPGAGNMYEHLFFSPFIQSETRFTDWLVLNIGLRSDLDFVRGRLEVVPNCERALFPCYRFSSPLVARASIVTKVNKSFNARISYGYAFLSPSNQQLYGRTQEDARDARDLLPQDKHSVELNINTAINKRWFLTWSVYYNWLNNVQGIVLLPYRQYEQQVLNLGNQETLGTRLYSVFRVAYWMSIIANLGVMYPRLFAVGIDDAIWLRDFPLFQANLIVDFRSAPREKSHVFGSLRVNFQTGRQNTEINQQANGQLQLVPESERAVISPQFLLNLSVGYLWIPPENFRMFRKLSVSATIENVLNNVYFDLGLDSGRSPHANPYVPQPGFNAFLNATAHF
jgi:hypothetical protein